MTARRLHAHFENLSSKPRIFHLTRGLMDRNPRAIDQVIAILEPLRDGFDGARAH